MVSLCFKMPGTPLLFIDTRSQDRPFGAVAEGVQAAAGILGLEVRRVLVASADDLAAVSSVAPLLVLFAPDAAPLFTLARRARSFWPDTPIVFLSPALRLLALRNELSIRGLFGDLYRTQDTAGPGLVEGLTTHIGAAQKRQALKITLQEINAELSRYRPDPPSIRGLLQSNQYLASLLVNVPDGIVFLDPQGIISMWNTGATALFGYDEQAAVGRSLKLLSCSGAGDPETDLMSVLAAAMDGKVVVRRDLRLCDAAGHCLDVDATLAEILDERKRRLGFSLFMRDVTARNRYQESLASERERLWVTLRSIGDGVITTDTSGRVTLLNPVAEALCGWSLAEALGRPLHEVFPIVSGSTAEPCADPVAQVLRTNTVVELSHNTVLIHRDGGRRAIADSGAPIRDAAGRITGVVLVFRDVTEKQRTEEALLRARQLESIGVLAGGIAHDFNNILTALFGNVSLIRLHTPPQSPVLSLLDQVDQAFYRARDLTQQLLTFAKGGAPIKRAGSFRDLVEETTRFLLHGTNAAVEFQWPDDFWVAEFDPGQMSQAVSNIILNAVQAMPGGGLIRITGFNVPRGREEMPLLKDGPYVRVSIKDQGPGIPEADRERVFHPYFSTKDSGTGLGLATTYSVLQRHGGQVAVGGDVGGGAVFDMYLPATHQGVVPSPQAGQMADPGSGYIVVMDDEEPVRKVCREILGHLGYQVEAVADGAALVALYAERVGQGRRPDAVIVDLTIPGGMDGREAAQQVLALDPHACLLVSSGYCTDPVVSDYKSYGFAGVVTKPYDIPEMAATLARVTRARHELRADGESV